jgi:purine nucleoside permease
MSDMEDQGIAAALARLAKMGRVDFQRVLFLRTASNYCMQAPRQDVNKSLHIGLRRLPAATRGSASCRSPTSGCAASAR